MLVDTNLAHGVGLKLCLMLAALAAVFAGVQLGSLCFIYYVQLHYSEDALVHTLPILLNNSLLFVLGITITRVFRVAQLCDSNPPTTAGEHEAYLKPLVGPSRDAH